MVDYNPTVLEHITRPANVGRLEPAAGVGVGQVESDTCGDMVEVSIRVERGIITAARFRVFGCGAAIAGASMLTRLAEGRPLAAAAAITDADLIAALGGLPPTKERCAALAPAALARAIAARTASAPTT
jgi:nitrogen fixation protein NifU and related proteins